METDLLGQGLGLMLAGMGVVFVFLSVLVGATALMSRIVMRFQPATGPPLHDEEIAAISAAIRHHRSRQKE